MHSVLPVEHYRAYRPRPFTTEERSRTTVLFGGLTWKHERLVQGVMHNLGYRAEPLPTISRADLDAGKELIDVGACCPTTFTTGNLVRFARARVETEGREALLNDYVFMTAGACGPCRFGQYHESYSMALDGMGLGDFRMFLLAQDQLDQGGANGGGLEIDMRLSLGLVWAILCADLLTDLEYMTRPYELQAGQTDRVLKASIERLYDAFRQRTPGNGKWSVLARQLWTRHFTRTLADVRRMWEAIPVDRLRMKPRVKITGEFWLQTHEGDGNYNIKRWLEQEGAEVTPPPVAVWLNYLMHQAMFQLGRRAHVDRRARLKLLSLKGVERLYRWNYDRMRHALGDLPSGLPSQSRLRELAAPYFNHQLRGGEGHMLIGKALDAHQQKKAHMICELSPYGCMPNTMSVGAMAQVLGDHTDLLYAAIEVKGDAEVHALSRCQMILTEARRRAQDELDRTLENQRMTPERIRRYEEAHPEVTRAAYRVPHYGRAGTAANYVTHIARMAG